MTTSSHYCPKKTHLNILQQLEPINVCYIPKKLLDSHWQDLYQPKNFSLLLISYDPIVFPLLSRSSSMRIHLYESNNQHNINSAAIKINDTVERVLKQQVFNKNIFEFFLEIRTANTSKMSSYVSSFRITSEELDSQENVKQKQHKHTWYLL